jgi:3-oxoacyl-[acyl-carrier protein] reductase
MGDQRVMLVTGTRKGIGHHLAQHYAQSGILVVGCSREPVTGRPTNYEHHCLDVADEDAVRRMVDDVRRRHGRIDYLLNNAGIASMNHALLTPASTVQRVLATNVLGTFVTCREVAKVMRRARFGRIVNFVSVATPLRLEGEAIYAASKAAVVNLTQILAREFGEAGITVNAVGPTPIRTDLIRSIPEDKLERLVARQAIRRFGECRDVVNVLDFFLRDESDFVSGQVIYLGGVS